MPKSLQFDTVTLTSSETDNLLEICQQNVNSKIVTVAEITRWKEMQKKQDITILSTNAIDALEAGNAALFPHVWKLLTIWATLLITTTTCHHCSYR